ncbi:HET-domain-containing protein, partial [Echria macrotheca]
METYQYERIDLASDAIRLLYLNRGYDGHPIECRLFETPLNEGIPYEALSYDCGDSAKLVEITLDGRKAHITENLFEALRHLRLVNRDRILWVDAICINQDDDKERGHQVRQMRTIYRNAEQVIVWLGISTSPIPSLIPSLISSFMDKMNEMHEDLASSSIGTENSLALWENVWSKSNVCTLYGYRLALENLLKRDWFKRVWSIQEVASARRAVVVCGWQSVPTKTFVRVPSMLKAPLTKLIQDVLDVMPGPLRRESWWAGQRDLHTLMVKFESLEAADPRDQIFALLGISSDACDNSTFPPNYEKPLSETLRDAARFLIF